MSDASLTEGPGSVLGNYRLIEAIGEGGFGVVYRAEQSEPVQRQVALKVIKLGMDTRQVVARFEAERQALALMDHPSIARVYDAGTTETGRPFFVMELVVGEHLTDYCDRRRLDTVRRLELFRDVCLAVQHAHQKGILHRDLKPSNVLVTEVDGAPVPKVIDFGIAKAMQRQLTDSSLATEQFQVMGTPEYMAPEQAEGRDVDTRADVYALGAMLYELLTGSLPFKIGAGGLQDIGEVLRHIREVTPAKPSTRVSGMGEELATVASVRDAAPTGLARSLRGDLDWIVMKALEKDRERRYATVIELAEDVARHLRHEPVLASPPSTAYRVSKFVRRNRLLVGASAAVVLAILGSLGVLAWSLVRVSDERDVASQARAQESAARRAAEDSRDVAQRAQQAEAEASARASAARRAAEEALAESVLARGAERAALERAERSLVEANAVTDFLTGMITEVSPWHGGRDVTVREVLDQTAPTLAADFADQPRARAHIARAMANSYRALGLYEESGRQAKVALEVGREVFAPGDPELVDTLIEAVMLRTEQGRFDEAVALAQEALDQVRAAGGGSLQESSLLSALGNTYRLAGRLDEAEAPLVAAVELSEALDPPDGKQVVMCKGNLMAYYSMTDRRAEQDALVEEIYAWHMAHDGPEHPATLQARRNRTLSSAFAGRNAENLVEREDLLAITRRVLGDQHPHTLISMRLLANLYLSVARYEEAEALFAEALSTSTTVFGAEHMESALCEKNLGLLMWKSGRTPEAEPFLEHAVEVLMRELGAGHPDTTEARNVGAIVQYELGNLEGALQVWEAIQETREMVQGPESDSALSNLQNIAMVQTDLGRFAEAEENYARVLEAGERLWGRESRGVTFALNNLAALYQFSGRLDEAAALNEELIEIRSRVLGPEDDYTLGNVGNLAEIYHSQGHYHEALELGEGLLETRRRIQGSDHPETARALMIVARNQAVLGMLEDAEESMREALGIHARSGMESSTEAQAHAQFLAGLLLDLQRPEEAEPLLLDVLSKRREFFGAGHSLTLDTTSILAGLYLASDRAQQARPLIDSLLEGRRLLALAPDATAPAERAYADLLLTCPFEELRDPVAALPLARSADERTGHVLPEFLGTLAEALAANGEPDQARKAARVALERLPDDAAGRDALLRIVEGDGSGEGE